jgi:hypothetical protein
VKNSSSSSGAFAAKRRAGGSAFAFERQTATGFVSHPIPLRPFGKLSKKGRAAAGKRVEDHHRALTKRAHSSAQKLPGTSPNRSKSSESDDARSCGAQPFGIFINPLNHLGDFTMALDVGFSGCNKPKSLCKVSCNPVSIKRRAEPITFTHHVIVQHFFVRRAVVWIFRLSSRA